MISDAIAALDQAAADEAARVARRDRLPGLLAESDALLSELETLNLADEEGVPVELLPRLVALSRQLAAVPIKAVDQAAREVGPALDHIYDCQEVLFVRLRAMRGDRRAYEDGEEEAAGGDLDERILALLGQHPSGLLSQQLAERFGYEEQTAARRRARALADEGLVRCETGPTPNGKSWRRYFAVGEGDAQA